jgi:hypothetical protein
MHSATIYCVCKNMCIDAVWLLVEQATKPQHRCHRDVSVVPAAGTTQQKGRSQARSLFKPYAPGRSHAPLSPGKQKGHRQVRSFSSCMHLAAAMHRCQRRVAKRAAGKCAARSSRICTWPQPPSPHHPSVDAKPLANKACADRPWSCQISCRSAFAAAPRCLSMVQSPWPQPQSGR